MGNTNIDNNSKVYLPNFDRPVQICRVNEGPQFIEAIGVIGYEVLTLKGNIHSDQLFVTKRSDHTKTRGSKAVEAPRKLKAKCHALSSDQLDFENKIRKIAADEFSFDTCHEGGEEIEIASPDCFNKYASDYAIETNTMSHLFADGSLQESKLAGGTELHHGSFILDALKKIKDESLTDVPDPFLDAFERFVNYSKIINSAMKLNSGITEARKLARDIKDDIINLKSGQTLPLAFGYQADNNNHAMVLSFKRNSQGNFEIELYDSGGSHDYHNQQRGAYKAKKNARLRFVNVPESIIFPNDDNLLLPALLLPRLKMQERGYKGSEICNLLLSRFANYYDKNDALYLTPQKDGTCSLKSLTAWMHGACKDEKSYKRMKHFIDMRAACASFSKLQKQGADLSIEGQDRGLLLFALEEINLTAKKLLEKKYLTETEAQEAADVTSYIRQKIWAATPASVCSTKQLGANMLQGAYTTGDAKEIIAAQRNVFSNRFAQTSRAWSTPDRKWIQDTTATSENMYQTIDYIKRGLQGYLDYAALLFSLEEFAKSIPVNDPAFFTNIPSSALRPLQTSLQSVLGLYRERTFVSKGYLSTRQINTVAALFYSLHQTTLRLDQGWGFLAGNEALYNPFKFLDSDVFFNCASTSELERFNELKSVFDAHNQNKVPFDPLLLQKRPFKQPRRPYS